MWESGWTQEHTGLVLVLLVVILILWKKPGKGV